MIKQQQHKLLKKQWSKRNTAVSYSNKKPRLSPLERLHKYKAYLGRRIVRINKRASWRKRKNVKRSKRLAKSRYTRSFYTYSSYYKGYLIPVKTTKVAPYGTTKLNITSVTGAKRKHKIYVPDQYKVSKLNLVKVAKQLGKNVKLKRERPSFEYFNSLGNKAHLTSMIWTKLITTEVKSAYFQKRFLTTTTTKLSSKQLDECKLQRQANLLEKLIDELYDDIRKYWRGLLVDEVLEGKFRKTMKETLLLCYDSGIAAGSYESLAAKVRNHKLYLLATPDSTRSYDYFVKKHAAFLKRQFTRLEGYKFKLGKY